MNVSSSDLRILQDLHKRVEGAPPTPAGVIPPENRVFLQQGVTVQFTRTAMSAPKMLRHASVSSATSRLRRKFVEQVAVALRFAPSCQIVQNPKSGVWQIIEIIAPSVGDA